MDVMFATEGADGTSPIGRVGRSPRAFLQRLVRLEALIIAAVIATILAVQFEEPLTKRAVRFTPAGEGKSFQSFWYGDESSGGKSKAAAVRPLDWTCKIVKGFEYPYCGFGILFDLAHTGRGLDLGDYESIRFTLNYSGPSDVFRIVLKDHDPRYGRPGHPGIDKVNQANMLISQGRQIIRMNLSDFAVADWWKEQSEASGELALPRFNNILALEAVTGANAPTGLYRLRIQEIMYERKTVSTGAWYGGIAACWMLLIGCFLFHRRRQTLIWKRQLAASWRMTLDTIPQMVWSLDASGLVFFNRQWEQFTGVALGLAGDGAPWHLIHPADRSCVINAWKSSLASGQPFDIQYRLKHHSGKYRWVLARALPARAGSQAITGWYGTCTDIHDRVVAQQALKESIAGEREKSQQLKWTSEHDALTLLPNRRAFQVRLQSALAAATAMGGHAGLLLIDLDHFKHVNDSLGHAAGDSLLQLLAERLKNSVRAGDTVARIGGDEFAIIVENVESDQHLLKIGNEVASHIQAPLRLGRRALFVGASMGGALFPQDARSANDLFKCADTALYTRKSSGRGGTRLFHPHMLEEAERAACQLGFAREALNEGNVVPFYQAKIDLRTGKIAGFEALLRWNHPQKGLQLPETLLEAFKDYELAAKIGELMQHKVARDIRSWMDNGLVFGRVSINAAPAEFLRDDYAERLMHVLSEYHVPADRIEIEVTEHAFMEGGVEYVARALTRLKQAGATVSLDDFGTGYSSLSHLRDFPVDRVKIDKSFVQQMMNDGEIASIVAAVINLARSLNIDVVAEGVEEQAQLDLLRALGCHFAQGYLFGAAAEAREIPAMVSLSRAAA